MFILKKDGMYLANYLKSGIEEFDKRGLLTPVYTVVWSQTIRDAKPIDNYSLAVAISTLTDADIIRVEPKGGAAS